VAAAICRSVSPAVSSSRIRAASSAAISEPVGYLEDIEIYKIDEDLLDKVAPWRPRGIAGAVLPVFRDRPKWGQRWLVILPEGTEVPPDPDLKRRMQAQTARRPYLFKDPRFSYTLATWMPFLAANTTFLRAFREPQRTMNSIMRIVRDERYRLGHQDDSGTSVSVLDIDLPKRPASAEQARRGLAFRALRRAADEAGDPAARMPSGGSSRREHAPA
jgi:hypothetical protein